MDWHAATKDDVGTLANLALNSTDEAMLGRARSLLESWRTELAIVDGVAHAAVAVLPPTPPHARGYGAWWTCAPDSLEGAAVIERLLQVAAAVPGLQTLQVCVPSADTETLDLLYGHDFQTAFPLWTMLHDGETWPSMEESIFTRLRVVSWSQADPELFYSAYRNAYQDQRPVKPHSRQTWERIAAGASFAGDLGRLAIDRSGKVVAFALASQTNGTSVEIGPVGTVREWRRRGLSSALMSVVLDECRRREIASVTLTVDGESPTSAQFLYERIGFRRTEALLALHRNLDRSSDDRSSDK